MTVELRTYAFIDRLQPQMAALLGSFISGDPVVEGMSELFLEISPGSDIYRLVDAALKETDVKPGTQVVERQFGLTELHSHSQASVRRAGATVLDLLGITVADATPAQLVSQKVISNVDPHQAQLVNRTRRGNLLVAGESMLVVECEPAGYITAIGNEVEKYAGVKVIDVNGVGMYGRLWVSGPHAEVVAAQDAVHRAFDTRPWSEAP